MFRAAAFAATGVALVCFPALAKEAHKDQVALFSQMKEQGHTGLARKTREVDARPAKLGETIVTVIKGEGVETKSKPAEDGDWVVCNRCHETCNEEILVKAAKFLQRYGEAQSKPDAAGYSAFRPTGAEMGYFIVTDEIGAFTFKAPWGEDMVAKPGDAIVQVVGNESDTYRIAAASFACTYEIVAPAK